MNGQTALKKRKPRGFMYDLKHNKWLLLMSIPGLICIIMFRYVPMGGLAMAFQDYSLFKGITGSKWVGFANFQKFFGDIYFFRILRNTFLLGLYNLLWSFPAPILLALCINEVKSNKFKRVTQTITYLPYFISVVIIVGIMRSLFASDTGVINRAITALGGESISFFNSSAYFRSLYIGSGIWQSVGYNSIIYLAAITGIDSQLYEAATIDGASHVKCIIHITLPSIVPTIAVLLTMSFGSILDVGFEKVLLMYSPATYETADVISTYVYRMGIEDMKYGYSAAVGLLNSVVAVALLMLGNLFSKTVLHESLW